jgi:hypothetical protein
MKVEYKMQIVLNMEYLQSVIGMAIRVRVPDTRRVRYPTGTGTGTIFYLWVALVSDPNRDGYETGIFSHPRVIRRVPNTLLPL